MVLEDGGKFLGLELSEAWVCMAAVLHLKLSSLLVAVLGPGHPPSDLEQWGLCDDLYFSSVALQPRLPFIVESSS